MGILDGNIFENMRMIIPEHRQAMLNLSHEEKRMKKPILGEDHLNEVSMTLAEAIQDGRIVQVTVYKPFGNEVVEMTPYKIDPYQRKLKGVGSDDSPISINLSDILDVQR